MKTTDTYSAKEQYTITRGHETRPMRDAIGETLKVEGYILTESNETEILYLDCADAVYATNSQTFIREFAYIAGIIGDVDFINLLVIEGVSKSNRHYITCQWV